MMDISIEMMYISSGIINDFQWGQDRVDREVAGSRQQNTTSSNPIGPAYILILIIIHIIIFILILIIGLVSLVNPY